MKLYSVTVFEQIRQDGVFVHVSTADAVDVGGVRYAENGGTMYRTDGPVKWHETEAAALGEAAGKVAAMAAALTAQAERLRGGGR